MKKRNSLTIKMTIWYTLFMVTISVLLLVAVEFVWSQHIENKAEVALIDEVADASEKVEALDHEIILEKDIELYDDNVYISIYDQDERIVKGKLPAGIREYPEFEDENIEEIKGKDGRDWFVYDRQFFLDDGYVWIRGITEDPAGSGFMSFLMKIVLVCVPLLMIIAAIGGYVMSARAMKPITEITDIANEIKEGEDLSRRISKRGKNDEADRLADAFNGMFDRLEKVFSAEKRFTSDVSHELRTPLAVITSQSEYAIEDAEYREAALRRINEQSKMMTSLVNRLLTISRSDSGRIKLEMERISLSEICIEIVALEETIAAEKNAIIESDIEEGIYINGDYLMIVRIIINLIDNAIKYGREDGGVIKLSLKKEGYFAICKVSDNGYGIEEEHIERIWDRFYKASPGSSTGLGLAMVKSLTHAHNGTCEVESKTGEGSTFTVKIPVE